MRKFHHLGIPTATPRPGEYYLPEHKVHVLDYGTNPYGIEWMRYDPDCALPELVKNRAPSRLRGGRSRGRDRGPGDPDRPNSPSPGVRVAFIVADGAPVEFLQYTKVE